MAPVTHGPGAPPTDQRDRDGAEDRAVVPPLEDLRHDRRPSPRSCRSRASPARSPSAYSSAGDGAALQRDQRQRSRSRSPGSRRSRPIRGRCGRTGRRARSARGWPRALTMPSAQAAYDRREADLDQVLGLVHLHRVPGEAATDEAAGDPPEARGAQRPRQRPVDRHPGRIDDVRRAAPPPRRRARGCRRRAAGRCPAAGAGQQQVERRQHGPPAGPCPSRRRASRRGSMIDCSHGSSTIAPTPTPEKAMLMASAAAAHEPVAAGTATGR